MWAVVIASFVVKMVLVEANGMYTLSIKNILVYNRTVEVTPVKFSATAMTFGKTP